MVVENERAAVLLLRSEGREEREDLVVVCWANLELVESGAAALGPLLAMMLLLNAALAKERLAMKLIIGEVMWWRRGEKRKSGEIEVQKNSTRQCLHLQHGIERKRQVERERVFMPSGNGRL